MEEMTIFDPAEAMENDNARFQQDSRLYVQFYAKAELSPYLSSLEGRPIHEEKDYIRIMVPGNKLSDVDTYATPDYQRRFATLWDRYKAGKQQMEVGTPLTAWPVLSMSMAADLNAMNIFTVEQLSTVADVVIGRIPGGLTLREKAGAYLDASKDAAVATRLAEEKEQQAAIIADLQEQLREIQKQVASTTSRKAA